MALAKDCDHEMAYVRCPPCDGAEKRRPRRWEQMGLPFPARFETFCTLCDSAIHDGDMVTRVGGAYVHAEHAED